MILDMIFPKECDAYVLWDSVWITSYNLVKNDEKTRKLMLQSGGKSFVILVFIS